MTLKGNGLLKMLVPAIVFIAIVIIVFRPGSTSKQPVAQQKQDPSLQLKKDELEALGIEGDTPQDTVATLVGHARALREDVNKALDANKKLQEQNGKLIEERNNVQAQIKNALDDQRQTFDREQQQNRRDNQSLLDNVQSQFTRMKNGFTGSKSSDEGVPIGLGLESGGGPVGRSDDLTWVDPLDQRQVESEGQGRARHDGESSAFPTSFKAGNDGGEAGSRPSNTPTETVNQSPRKPTAKPVYTLPENSTLMGSLSITALLGRVPVDGTVNDPYPFKVMIGKDNLTANGIELPEVKAAVASGTATGDWTLSCVRGNITSLTFVFEDGTIRTVPSPEDVNQSNGNKNDQGNQSKTIGGGNSIGWISDQAGIPCISGIRRSNAQQYLGTQSLLTALGAGVASTLSDDKSISVRSMGADGGISQAMSGNQAVGQIMSQGVNDMSKWVNKLYGEAFAAVYVPPGQPVVININKQLPIDYETEGRKVRYDTSTDTTVGLD